MYPFKSATSLFPPWPIYQMAVSVAKFAAHTATSLLRPQPSTRWLCQLQTLQLTQPHHFSGLSHLPGGCVSCKVCSSHSHITFPPWPISQVAVSVANFAAHTATSLFRHDPSPRWLCQLQSLQLTQPHHFSALSHLPGGCVSCKVCSSHSHITPLYFRHLAFMKCETPERIH